MHFISLVDQLLQDMLDKLRRGSSVADRPEVSTNSKPEANIKREDSELVDGDTEFKVYMALPGQLLIINELLVINILIK